MRTVIVFGGNSQLAQCIKNLEDRFPKINMVFLSSKEADVSKLQVIESVFQKYKPHVIINCAAYTAVDLAESEVESATVINAKSPGYISAICNKYNTLLIHISTDFVFEGNKAFPLKESDDTVPLSIYGKTKLDGEKEIIKNMDQYIILRTSWLYSEYGHNFAKTMLRLGNEKDSLGVVADQIGTPTYAMDLAETILKIIDLNSSDYGVYHYSNEGVSSWYDFAHAIFKFAGLNVQLSPLSTAQFPTKAIRPAFSVMDKSKIKETFKFEIPHWQDSLESCLELITERSEIN
jgi:dTDP-4-dehydrorhamnose reductase